MYDSTAAVVISTEWVLLTIGAALIVARLHLRFRINRLPPLISDVFICLAWCSAVACSSFDIVFMRVGILRPGIDSNLEGFDGDKESLQRLLVYFWVRGFPFFITFYLYKAALLAFYMSIISEVFTVYRIVLWTVIVYTGLGFAISVLLNLFLCWPIERNWALEGTGCSKETGNLFNIAWALHFSSDIIIFFLPVYLFHTAPIRRLVVRLALYGLFGLGIIEIAICLTRFVVLSLPTPTAFTNIELWTAVDANLGVIIATLPSLRPYLRLNGGEPTKRSANGPAKPANAKTGVFAHYGFKDSELRGTTTVQSFVSNESTHAVLTTAPKGVAGLEGDIELTVAKPGT